VILHSRFYANLISDTFAGANGGFSIPAMPPAPDTVPKFFQKGQYVQTGERFNERNNPGSQNFDNVANVLDYNGDIVLKRVRINSNLPGAFFYNTFKYLGLGWFHNDQLNELPPTFDKNYCHWTDLQFVNMGEWYDINVVLPRNDTLLSNYGHRLYEHFRIGAWHEAAEFHYAGVPTSAQGQKAMVYLELETALTIDPYTWKGDRK
jgi:hypothetical protein